MVVGKDIFGVCADKVHEGGRVVVVVVGRVMVQGKIRVRDASRGGWGVGGGGDSTP